MKFSLCVIGEARYTEGVTPSLLSCRGNDSAFTKGHCALYTSYKKRMIFIAGNECLLLQLSILKSARDVSPAGSYSDHGMSSISPSSGLKLIVTVVICPAFFALSFTEMSAVDTGAITCSKLSLFCASCAEHAELSASGAATLPDFAMLCPSPTDSLHMSSISSLLRPSPLLPGFPLFLSEPFTTGSSSVVKKCIVGTSSTVCSWADTESANENCTGLVTALFPGKK